MPDGTLEAEFGSRTSAAKKAKNWNIQGTIRQPNKVKRILKQIANNTRISPGTTLGNCDCEEASATSILHLLHIILLFSPNARAL